MAVSRDEDPTLQLWERVRRPTLATVFTIMSLSQLPNLSSGNAFRTVTGILLVAFSAWLIWGQRDPRFRDKGTAEYWRRQFAWSAAWWAFWLVLACSWLAWGSARYGFRATGLTVLVMPVLGLVMAAFGYRSRDRLALGHAERKTP